MTTREPDRDSPQRDPDRDGFTNEEEYFAKTGPNNSKDYGDLSTKIELVKLIKEPYRLELSSESDGQYVLKYEDLFMGKRRTNRSAIFLLYSSSVSPLAA